jgi:sugar lactone lactonase YvrE
LKEIAMVLSKKWVGWSGFALGAALLSCVVVIAWSQRADAGRLFGRRVRQADSTADATPASTPANTPTLAPAAPPAVAAAATVKPAAPAAKSAAAAWVPFQEILPKKPVLNEKYRPKLLVELPDAFNTPDGMRLDKKTGNMIVACPNLNDKKYPAVLIQITPAGKAELYFDKCPKHPDTGYAFPMGMDFGPDGNLYYADNQYFENKDYKSRLVRVNIKDGKPQSADVVVDGFKLANAAMFSGNTVYVTDTFFDLDKPMGGVYAFKLDEFKKGVVKLKPKTEKDPHLVTQHETKPLACRANDTAAADGMTFDSKGNLYYGHFGDGQLFKISFNADGSVKSDERVGGAPQLVCCDGMFCDVRTDKIYIADSARNAIQVFDPKDKSVTTLWEDDDNDGSNGKLDQPCEPAIRGDDLIISNFDMPFPGLKNSKYDKPHTMSVIKLK